MQNAFTSLLKCKWPLVGPAMATAAGGRLAVAVTKGGGFGFISSSYQTLEWFKDQLDLVRRDLGTSAQRLPIGCGYLLWTLDDKPREEAEALVELGIKHSSAIWLAFGDSLQRWFTFVRERADPKDVRVFVVVSTVGEAVAAARLKPDVLVAQGSFRTAL
jgi:nitronate monooxygenase